MIETKTTKQIFMNYNIYDGNEVWLRVFVVGVFYECYR
jgi:hypothetical protein